MKRVLVIGDVMADVYRLGQVNRISPEAPIPVFEQTGYRFFPGGAANLAMNLAGCGMEVDLLTQRHTQEDENFVLLYAALVTRGVKLLPNEAPFNPHVIVKNRFVDARNNHQIGLRWDVEERHFSVPITADFVNVDVVKEYAAVVFSDYAKGTLADREFCQSIIRACENYGVLSFLDTRSESIARFSGVSYFKPNMREYEVYFQARLEARFGEDSVFRVGDVLRTESENGMTWNPGTPHELHVSSQVSELVDPTGAGDTVMAALVMSVLGDRRPEEILSICTELAAVSCRHHATYAVTQDDVRAVLSRHGARP